MNGSRKARGALSYANVMATVAVFVALGGTGYAAAKLGSKDVRDNSLRSADVRNGTLSTKDVRNGTLRAKDLKAGQVVTATGEAAGAGTPALWTFRLNALGFEPYGLPRIPGIGQFVFSCGPTGPGAPRLFFDSESDAPLEATSSLSSNLAPQFGTDTIPARGHTAFGFLTPSSQLTLQLAPKSDEDPGPVVTAIVSVVQPNGTDNCDVVASVHAAESEPTAPIDAESQR